MKRFMISAFAAVALFAAATTLLRSPSTELFAGTAAMPSLQELHTGIEKTNKNGHNLEMIPREIIYCLLLGTYEEEGDGLRNELAATEGGRLQ